MFRRLTALIFALSLLLTILSIALWVRTYPLQKDVYVLQRDHGQVTLTSNDGALTIAVEPTRPDKYHPPIFRRSWLRIYRNAIPFPDPWDVDAQGYHDGVVYTDNLHFATFEWQEGYTKRTLRRIHPGGEPQPGRIITPTERYILKLPYWAPMFIGLVGVLFSGWILFGSNKPAKS